MNLGQRKRWRKWILRTVVALVVLLGLVRVTLPYAVPSVLANWAEKNGLVGSYEKLDLSVSGGRVEIWHLVLRDASADPVNDPIVHVEYATFNIDVPSLLTGSPVVSRIEIDGLDLDLVRREDGSLELPFGGTTAEPEVPAPRPKQESSVPSTLEFPVSLAALRVQEVQLHYLDESVDPPLETNLEFDLRISDAGSSDRPLRIELRARVDGIVNALRLTARGDFEPERAEVDLRVNVDGVYPVAAAPLLEPLGIVPVAERLGFDLAANLELSLVEGAHGPVLRAAASLTDIAVEVNDQPRMTVAAVTGQAEMADAGTRVRSALVSGIRGGAERLDDGTLRVMGLELRGGTSAGPDVSGEADADETPGGERKADQDSGGPDKDGGRPGLLAVDSLRLEDIELDLDDYAFQAESGTPHELHLGVDSLEVTSLVLDPTHPVRPSNITAVLRVPDAVEQLSLEGSFVPTGPELSLHVGLDVRGITLASFAPYLSAAGIESVLEDGRLLTRLSAKTTLVEGEVRGAELLVSGFTLSDGERGFLSFDELGVPDAALSDGEVDLGLVRVTNLDLPLVGDERGSVALLGIRTLVEEHSIGKPFELGLRDLGLSVTGLAFGGSRERRAELQGGFAIEGLLRGASIGGEISTRPGDLDVALDLELAVRGLVTGGHSALQQVPGLDAAFAEGGATLALDARIRRLDEELVVEPASFDLAVTSTDTFERLGLRGDLYARGTDVGIDAELELTGVRGDGELARALPPGIEIGMEAGSLLAKLVARSEAAPDGGSTASVEIERVSLRDGDEVLVALDSAKASVSRMDLEAGVVALDEIALRGLEIDVTRTAPDRLLAAGLAISTTPDPVLDEEPAPAAEVEASPPSKSTPIAQVKTEGEEATALMPRVTLNVLDVGVARFGFTDQTAPEAVPLSAAFALRNEAPLVLFEPDLLALAPIKLGIQGEARPIVEDLSLGIVLSPWNDRPEFSVELVVSGIRGAGITEVVPDLTQTLDGSQLDGATFTVGARVAFDWRRRGPFDFDLRDGFACDLEVRDLALRAKPEGDVLAGLESLDALVQRISPSTGDVQVRGVELVTPTLHAVREADGVRVAGLLFKTPAAPPTPGDSEVQDPEGVLQEGAVAGVGATTVEAVADRTDEEAVVATERQPETRIDYFGIEGLDVRFTDITSDPVMEVPLTGLDLEIHGFSNRIFEEERQVRFAVYLTGGDVALPERTQRTLLGGLAHRALKATGLGADADMEGRALFDELAVSGSMEFHPALQGWSKIDLSALELLGFAGPAAGGGVKIGDGVLDAAIDLRFRGERGVQSTSTFTFQHLSLSEPANGPVSRYLKLPAPLDAVLFVLKNDDGEHVIPLKFSTTEASVGTGKIAGAATRALGRLITDAIASSPFRVAGTLTGLVGLTGNDEPEDLSEDAVVLVFEPADTSLPGATREVLAPLLKKVAKDEELALVLRHELCPEDVARADVIANPTPEACLELTQRLRGKRAELVMTRADLVAEARAFYAVGQSSEAADATTRLRAIDAELGRTEDSLDRLTDLLRPGAERRREKRTRSSCLEIAAQRLSAVRESLVAEGVPPDRIEVRRARFSVSDGEAGHIWIEPKRRP